MQVQSDNSAPLMVAIISLTMIARELTTVPPNEAATITLERLRKMLEPIEVTAPNLYQMTKI